MIKLTDERIQEIWADGTPDPDVNDFARAIEAEVLRLNGIKDNGASEEREFWIGVCEGLDKTKQSPTAGMNLAQRILHVGGRNNAAGYVEFGSVQAVQALVHQVLRDLPKRAPLPASEIVTMYVEAPKSDAEMVEFAREVERAHDIHETNPRATGCPDTMDDTGRFAEVDMPAFLRKQNPA